MVAAENIEQPLDTIEKVCSQASQYLRRFDQQQRFIHDCGRQIKALRFAIRMRFTRVRALSSLSQIALDPFSQASSINPHSYRVSAMPGEVVYPFEYSAGAR